MGVGVATPTSKAVVTVALERGGSECSRCRRIWGSCEAAVDGVSGVIGNPGVAVVDVVVARGVYEGWQRRRCTELVVAVARGCVWW